MPLASIKLKPGIVTVQTPTLNEGGWSAGSNIRFFEGLPQKDAGFVNIATVTSAGIIKALKAWEALSAVNYLGIGGVSKLEVWNGSVLTDISPEALTSANVVTLDNWGEFLMVCYMGGPVYVWQPAVGGTAQNILSAPQTNAFIFVAIQQQILVCCGSVDQATGGFDPMLIRWSDVGDYTDFTPTPTNQAGSFRLPLGSKIAAGLVIPGQNLIWTDTTLYSMQYIQFPLVWGFQPLGNNCGAVGPHAVGLLAGTPFWMSQNQFFTLGAEGPAQIQCPVWDSVFVNADPSQLQNVVCQTDSYYGEVSWTVPQLGGGSITARLSVGGALYPQASILSGSGIWTVSNYHNHTAWIDQNVFGPPIGGHDTSVVDQHDTGYDANGEPAPWSLTSGIIMISEGDEATFIRDMIPDFLTENTNPTISLSVSAYDYPDKAPRVHGPYTITNATQVIHPRCRGRGIQFTLSGNDLGTFMRLGNVRYRGQQDGRR